MPLLRRRGLPGIELNITPLIDVIFLLIIFLMTVQEFSRLELEELNLPRAEEALQTDRPPAPQRVVVNIRPDGRFVVTNREMDLVRLQDLLRRERDRLRSAGRKETLTVVVRADGATPYRYVQDLLSTVASLGIWQVRIAAIPGRERTPPER